MAIIRLHTDALNPQRSEVVHVGAVSLLSWLRDNAPWADVVVRNGQQLEPSTDVELCEFDSIDVFKVPSTGLEWYWMAAIAVGAAVVTYALMPKPETPNNAGQQKTSPNNQLNAASNEFRRRQALPHIYGKVRSYPDFVQSSYYFYENNKKTFKEVFLVTAGSADVTDVRTSNTPIEKYNVYQPGDTLPQFYDVRGTNEINDFMLTPPDDATFYATGDGIISNSGARVFLPGVVDALTLSVGTGVSVQFFGTDDEGVEVNFSQATTVSSIVDSDTITVSPALPASTATMTGQITVVVSGGQQLRSQWYVLEGDTVSEVWVHVKAPNGLVRENGSGLQVAISVSVEEVDADGSPLGSPIVRTFSIAGSDQTDQYRTFRVTDLPPSRYRARVMRTTNSFPAGSIDKVVLEDIVSVRPIDSSKYGDVTLLTTERTAGVQQSAGGSAKTNCLAQRRIEIFNPATGTFGASAATRSFAKILMHYLVYEAKVPIAKINYQKLFAIESSLNDPRLGYFDFTFDDKDVSVGQTVETILNTARCFHWLAGDVYEFERDEWKPARAALFNPRNTLPESSEQAFTPHRDYEYDSVEVKYVDPESNTEAYVRRRINASTGAIEEGLGLEVNEIDLAGCRDEWQATNRAELEIRKLKYQWLQVSTTVTAEGLTVGLGQKVGWVDINDSATQSGEILAFNGLNVFTTSEPVKFESGKTYYAYIIEQNGDVSPQFEVVAVADESNKFRSLTSGLVPVISDGYEVQQGSLYVIAELDRLKAQDFIVTRRGKPDDKYNVQLELVNTREEIYEFDSQLPPPPPEPDPELIISAYGGTVVINNSLCVNADAIATVTASGGDGVYTYAWTKISGDGSIVSGASDSTATVRFSSVCPEESKWGVYRCTVTSGAQTKSVNVTFQAENIAANPNLKAHISGSSVEISSLICDTATVTGTAVASGGTGSYTYAWSKVSGSGTITSGTTSASLSVQFTSVCAGTGASGVYKCIVSDGVQSVTVSAEFSVSNTYGDN